MGGLQVVGERLVVSLSVLEVVGEFASSPSRRGCIGESCRLSRLVIVRQSKDLEIFIHTNEAAIFQLCRCAFVLKRKPAYQILG